MRGGDGLFEVEPVEKKRSEGRPAAVDRSIQAFDPHQALLLPPSLDDRLLEDHLARFVADLVDEALDARHPRRLAACTPRLDHLRSSSTAGVVAGRNTSLNRSWRYGTSVVLLRTLPASGRLPLLGLHRLRWVVRLAQLAPRASRRLRPLVQHTLAVSAAIAASGRQPSRRARPAAGRQTGQRGLRRLPGELHPAPGRPAHRTTPTHTWTESGHRPPAIEPARLQPCECRAAARNAGQL